MSAEDNFMTNHVVFHCTHCFYARYQFKCVFVPVRIQTHTVNEKNRGQLAKWKSILTKFLSLLFLGTEIPEAQVVFHDNRIWLRCLKLGFSFLTRMQNHIQDSTLKESRIYLQLYAQRMRNVTARIREQFRLNEERQIICWSGKLNDLNIFQKGSGWLWSEADNSLGGEDRVLNRRWLFGVQRRVWRLTACSMIRKAWWWKAGRQGNK